MHHNDESELLTHAHDTTTIHDIISRIEEAEGRNLTKHEVQELHKSFQATVQDFTPLGAASELELKQ